MLSAIMWNGNALFIQMMTVEKWLTLIVESVYPVDGGTLVVAAQHEEVLGVLQQIISYGKV